MLKSFVCPTLNIVYHSQPTIFIVGFYGTKNQVSLEVKAYILIFIVDCRLGYHLGGVYLLGKWFPINHFPNFPVFVCH